VDLTNYVMFELGQPLHAFDAALVQGQRIVVREALDGERMTTLDEIERELEPGMLLICDGEGPVAVAGVMGGSTTEVSETTTSCLLESAHFDNQSVRRTRKRLGLQTEASYRFERSVDPEGVVRALDRFADLLEEITGAKPVGGAAQVVNFTYQPAELDLSLPRCRALLVEFAPMPGAAGGAGDDFGGGGRLDGPGIQRDGPARRGLSVGGRAFVAV